MFAMGLAFMLVKLQEKGGGKTVNQPFSTGTVDSILHVQQLSGRLPYGLWEIERDSNTYLLYVDGSGSSLIKK